MMTPEQAAAELTRLGEDLGPDAPPGEVVALCKEARRELAAEETECRSVRLVPVDEAEDDR